MLPMICNQPPCMNIDVMVVYQDEVSPSTQTLFGPICSCIPAGTVCKS